MENPLMHMHIRLRRLFLTSAPSPLGLTLAAFASQVFLFFTRRMFLGSVLGSHFALSDLMIQHGFQGPSTFLSPSSSFSPVACPYTRIPVSTLTTCSNAASVR